MSAIFCRTLPLQEDIGYGLDQGATNRRFCATGRECKVGPSDIFGSLEEALDDDFSALGFRPCAAVLALPGTYDRTGRLAFTNLTWPSVTVEELSVRYGGIKFELVNDMQAALLGATCVDRDQLVLLKQGNPHPSRHRSVLTLSSGVNWTSGPAGLDLQMAREAGHTRLALTGPITKLVEWVSKHIGASASIENLLSGNQGVGNIVEFLLSEGHPSLDGILDFVAVAKEIQYARRRGVTVSELMTAGALQGHPFWVATARIYAELLGYLVNEIVVGDLVGELLIQGPVLNGTPGFAEWVFAKPEFQAAMVSHGMEKSFIADDVTVYGVPTDIPMATLGAECRARALIQS
jgi:glucokinase